MAQQSDQVFQLSLTEIAFTIAFILLLLLGYLVFKEQTARMAAEAALASVQTAERTTAALEEAKKGLAVALQGAGASNPDEAVTKLIAAEATRAERDQLKKRVEDLDEKLTAMTELQKQLEKAAQSARPNIMKDEIEAALALQEQVRKALNDSDASAPPSDTAPQLSPRPQPAAAAVPPNASATKSVAGAASAPVPVVIAMPSSPSARQDNSVVPKERRIEDVVARVKQAILTTSELRKQLKAQLNNDLKAGHEADTVRDVVAAAKDFGELANASGSPNQIKKENTDLRGQVAFLKNRLDARGGRDFPPCWADETGKVEFLFSVEVKPDSVVVTQAWPQRREAAAQELPGLSEVLAGPHTNQGFAGRIQGIFRWSKSQDPECRHYVQLKSSIQDAVQSDRARLMVENYFYKTEARR